MLLRKYVDEDSEIMVVPSSLVLLYGRMEQVVQTEHADHRYKSLCIGYKYKCRTGLSHQDTKEDLERMEGVSNDWV